VRPRLAHVVIALAVACLPGCDFNIGGPSRASTGPYPLDGFAMRLFTPEGDTARHLLVVGDSGIATIEAFGWDASCSFNGCHQAVNAQFTSSDEGVVSPGRVDVLGFAQFGFVARRPGSVVLSTAAQGQVITARVDVVAAALPVDSVRVRRWAQEGDSLLAAVTDAAGNVDTLTLPRDSVPACDWCYHLTTLRALAFRGGDSTVYLPMTFRISDSSVVGVATACRFPGQATCDEPAQVWIIGDSPGTATVTVAARGRQYSFVVKVVLTE
jgi:hypothetical protein